MSEGNSNCIHKQFESPAWHEDALKERMEAVKSGKETFVDWELVKKRLRKKFQNAKIRHQ